MAYTLPTAGTPGYGTTFNSITGGLGANNNNAIPLNTWGAGLWAGGFDPNQANQGPEEQAKMMAALNQYIKANNINGSDYFAKNPQSVPGTIMGDMSLVDWWIRDQARRQDKSNSFLDSTLGKIVAAGLPIATGGLGAFAGLGSLAAGGIGAATGATLGGLKGGPLGAILGGVGGYGGGLLGSSLVNNGIMGTINNAVSGVKSLFNPSSNASFVNPNALGGAEALYTPSSVSIPSSQGLGLLPQNLYNPASLGGGILGAVNTLKLPAGSLYNPLSSRTTFVNGVPIQSGPTNPPIAGPAALQPNSPGILEATKDLASASAKKIGTTVAKNAATELISGLLAPEAPAEAGGIDVQPWGGKFKEFQSPYRKALKLKGRRGISINIA